MKRILGTSLLAVFCMSLNAQAQDAAKVSIPTEKMACLVENEDTYLDLPRNVIIFFAEYCPAVSRIEIAEMVQNSEEKGREIVRLFLLKSEFQCLVGKIEAHLEIERAAAGTSDEVVEFSLDCN